MTKSTKTLLACAAIAGLYSGSLAVKSYGAPHVGAGTKLQQLADKDKSSCSGKDGCNAKEGDKSSCKGVHDCKGKNDCKAQGGCKSSDNGCKGQNSCKGKGGCSTAKKHGESAPKA